MREGTENNCYEIVFLKIFTINRFTKTSIQKERIGNLTTRVNKEFKISGI
jgi:hypothetical protein